VNLETWELASYVVTVVGLPFAIVVFMLEQRKERQNEEEEIYQQLSDEYGEFLKLLLQNADLQLTGRPLEDGALTDEQRERRRILFELLISLFERAYLLVYEEHMSRQTARLWGSWEDYMRFWCSRPDFRSALEDGLLEGEDPDFSAHIRSISTEARGRPSVVPHAVQA
jgi:hypothetical protein